MQDSDITRINELYHKQKAGTLTPEEAVEQKALRQEYIQAIRKNLRGSLDTVTIQEPDGTKINLKERHDAKYGTEE